MVTYESNGVVAEATVENLGKRGVIGTGICFLDHMVDQLTSHAQLGVSLRVRLGAEGAPFAPLKDYAVGPLAGRAHDEDIVVACGGALGRALRVVAADARGGPAAKKARVDSKTVFCCPLDEAYCEATLDLFPGAGRGGECEVALEPYGTMCSRPEGRERVGRYRTALTPAFWQALAAELGATLKLVRVRGDNAHHVLESTFKAFARAFRAAVDGVSAPVAYAAPAAPRRATRLRATKETSIEVVVDLEGAWLESDAPTGPLSAWTGETKTPPALGSSVRRTKRLDTGIPLLDDVLGAFAQHADIHLLVHCAGDRHIDDHHTAEDVAITVGQCLHEALGDKAGLVRMACADRTSGGVAVRAVLDLSNRPHVASDLAFDEEYLGGGDPESPDGDVCGAVLSSEMFFHALESLTLEMRATLHLEVRDDDREQGHTLPLARAAAAAYGAALHDAIRVDPRRGGGVASSKGTLSC